MSEARHPTPALEGLVAIFRLLKSSEQEEALKLCHGLWLDAQEAQGSEISQAIASLRRVAEVLGQTPGIEDYKRVRAELTKDGEELWPSSRILRVFDGSWHLAKEAVDLSEISTSRRIEERFRKRQLGKVWRYTEETLAETVRQAVEALGHVPQLAEFDHWRQRQIELAQARGEDLHLPGGGPYRRRFGSWEEALLHFGYTPDEVSERLERKTASSQGR